MTTPANPDDLITWLRAQLDEDERGRLLLADMLERLAVELDEEAQESEDGGGYTEPQVFRWAAQHVRDRAAELVEEYRQLRLAEVDAKRRILDGHPFEQGIVGGVCGTCHGAGRLEVHWDGEEENLEHVDTEMVWPCPTVRLLASVYADREGFREEWRPA